MTRGFLACASTGDREREIAGRLRETLVRHNLVARWRGFGLSVFASEDLSFRPLEDRSGMVIGTLFDRAGDAVDGILPGTLTGSEAAGFVDRYWGAYVALAASEDGVRILRDPSGGLACYHAHVEGSHYFTTMPHLLFEGGVLEAEIDWREVGQSLTRHATRRRETALRGIDEVLPGTLLRVEEAHSSIRPVWNPWRHAGSRRDGDPAEQLEGTLRTTFRAWAGTMRSPLLEISGGLDSAIVAAGIAPVAREASLITFAAAPGDPDETTYARAIADRLGLPLEIARPRVEDVDLTRSLSSDLPRPNARAFTQAADAQSLLHARAIGADAFVSGGGGDDVFCYLRTILPALDRLRAEGALSMLATARDIAVMNHATVWDALHRIVRRLGRGGPSRVADELLFIAPDHRPSVPAEPDDSDRGAPPGKAMHVWSVLTIHNYLEGHARASFAPILSPLLSQPIVECCLSIPTWLWCDQGQNRAVARRAFAGRLPDIVVERRSKGSFDAFCARLFHVNRRLILELLVEGELAGHGILDRQAVAAALRQPSPSAETIARILALVDTESWVRSWTSRPIHGA